MTAHTAWTGWLRRLVGGGEPRDRAELTDDLREAGGRGLIDADALTMIEGVLGVADLQVRDIMVPRSRMVVLDRDDTPERVLPVIVESGHSRFPVIGEDRDQVVGLLLAKDLLRYFRAAAGRISTCATCCGRRSSCRRASASTYC